MADLIEPIKIEGLAQFSRNLRKLDNDLPKALRIAQNDAAGIVVEHGKPKVPEGDGRGGHAASSMRAKSTRTSARVTAGGARFPYYAWLDFGGRVGRHKHTVRPFKKSGRYMFVAFVQNKGEVAEALHAALLDVVRQAGIEVTE